MRLLLKHWVKKLPTYWDVCFIIHNVFFSLLKDEQHLSENNIGLTNLGQNIKAAKSTVLHNVKPKQREQLTYICMQNLAVRKY